MSSYQKFTKNIGIIGSANVLVALEAIILLPVITKLLGAANYGIWVQLGVTISLIAPLALLGLPFTLVRFLAGEKDKKEIQEGVYSVLSLIFIVVLIISLVFIIFSGSIASFFQCQPILIKILALIISLQCLNLVLLGVLQAFQRIKEYAFFLIFKAFGEIGLVILAVFLGYGLFGAVLSLLVIRLAIFLPLFALTVKRIGIKIPAFSGIKKYLHFGLPTVVSSVSYWMVTSSDRYLISFFLGVLFVGYYAPAYAIGNLLVFLIYPLAFMLPPVLSKLFDEEKINEVKTYLKYSLKYFLIIAIPISFGLSILSKQLLTIFSTEEIATNAYFITPFIVLSILLYGVYTIFVQILILFKKTKIFGAIWIGAAFLNIVLNLIFIPIFGILAAALTTLFAYVLGFGLTWHFSFKRLQFEIDWPSIIKSILASVLMVFFILWFGPVGLLKTITAIILGALVYGISIFLFKGFNKKEIKFIHEILSFNK